MAYYLLEYETEPDYMERRGAYRKEHLALAQNALQAGSLVMAGALADPPDRALLVFKADTAEVAVHFAQNDPYVQNGLIKRWSVREWNVVVGDLN